MPPLSIFVSYTGADRSWAEWIAFTLEEAGHRVVIQAWDFRPGSNFVLEMDRAARETDRTLVVLSSQIGKWGGSLTQGSKPRSADTLLAADRSPYAKGLERR